MKLKSLEIRHLEYYASAPTTDKYKGKVEFFNEKGEGLIIQLNEDQLAGIVELCAKGLVTAAQQAAESIVASVKPLLQIEQAA